MRINQPNGYANWNSFIELAANDSIDQTIETRRLIKRNIKLDQISSLERAAGGNVNSSSYRPYHVYEPPGTFSPFIGHPYELASGSHIPLFVLVNGIWNDSNIWIDSATWFDDGYESDPQAIIAGAWDDGNVWMDNATWHDAV